MADHREPEAGADGSPTADLPDSPDIGGSAGPRERQRGRWDVTRRDVLVTGSASVLAPSLAVAEADKPYLDVTYEDRSRRGVVIAWVEAGPKGKRYPWTLRASTFTDPDLPRGDGRFVLRRTKVGWRAEIARCALPGRYAFGLQIDVKWDPRYDPETKAVEAPSITITLDRGTNKLVLSLGTLIAFLKAEDETKIDEIAGQISKTQLTTLAHQLFGSTFDAGQAADVQLAFHREAYWILRAGKKLSVGEAEPLAAKPNRFRALSDEGVSLPFREVSFTVFSGRTGASADDTFVLDPKARNEREDVRALFAGDGAPPAPDSTLSKPPPEAGEASRRQAARAPSVPARSPDATGRENAVRAAEERRLAPRVLYALVRRDLGQTKTDPQDAWKGVLALGRHSGGESAGLSIHEGSDASFLGWRNEGDDNPVFALRMPHVALALQRAPGATATRFDALKGQVWRALAADGKQRMIASLTPTRRRMLVETRFGRFVVAPLPAIAPRPGVSARTPSIRIGGTDAKNARTLNHFAAPFALEEAAIPLGSERLAPTGAAGMSAERAARLFSQLTFHEAECLFHVEKLARQHVWKGQPAPLTDPPQAEALVHVGAADKDSRLPARLSLNAASLLVRRPADLLALKYRFQDLVLEYGEVGWWVVPDRRLAAFVVRGEPKPEPAVPLICEDKPTRANEPARYEMRQDPRPLLAVEFPPQHIAERAYLRRFEPDADLPLPRKEVTREEAEILRTADEKTRKSKRQDIAERQTEGLPDDDAFLRFHNRFKGEVDEANKLKDGWKRNIPSDQRIYVGPAYLDLEAARVARRLARAMATETGPADLGTTETRARALRIVPEVELAASVTGSLRNDFTVYDDISEGYPEPARPETAPPMPTDAARRDRYFEAREKLRCRLDPRYAAFRRFYQKELDRGGVANLPKPFYGRRNVIAQVEHEADPIAATKALLQVVDAFDAADPIDEAFEIPTEARASGPSRLVFRIPADDFEAGRPDAREGAPAGSFPFTIEALTNWGAFDLAVVRRAEKVFEPLAGARRASSAAADLDARAPQDAPADIANGRLPPRWARQESRDEAAKLLHQGLTRGDAWAVRHDEQRALDKVADCPKPLDRLGSVTGPQRMAEIAASVRPPSLYETSIELPFRLMLSPAQDAAWRVPLGLPPIAKLAAAKDRDRDQGRPVPLWFAQLDEAPGSSSVRAIWSPDFRPEALLDPELGGPPHGPWAPWAMPRDVTSRNPFDGKETPDRFRTGLDVADRHELVALTSLHGLPVRGRRKPEGTLADGSQISPPPGFRLRNAELEKPGDLPLDDYAAIYRPQALGVGELTLTALGGSFDADTNFIPPVSAKVVPIGLWRPDQAVPGHGLFDAFSVERWQQNTRLGRDIRVEVVYKGFLFPVGHRASLVKLTERRFMVGPGGLAAGPVAYLVQRFFLRIGTPLKTYPALGQPNGGRRWPVERLEILTRVTPDILDPADAAPSDAGKPRWEETANGRIYLRAVKGDTVVLPGLVFWPRVRAREGGEVNFELQIDARGSRARLPLIFVDNTAANDEVTMAVLADEYGRLKRDPNKDDDTIPDDRRVLRLGGGKRRYAAEKEPDGTSFETETWEIRAEGREATPPRIYDDDRRITFDNTNFDFGVLLQGVDQPPFYPVMGEAEIRIGQVDRLVGRPTGTIPVFFDPEYQAFGFPPDAVLEKPNDKGARDAAAKADVYLDFRKAVALDPVTAGERTGGAVRPVTMLVGLSRSRGAIGNNSYAKLAQGVLASSSLPPVSTGLDTPDPKNFFGDATVLGIIDLKEAIQFVIQAVSATPQFKEVTQYTSALLADLTDDAAEAGAAVAKVRDRLLIPMREALLTLSQQFFYAIEDGANAVFDEDDALERIERLYPDVGKSYRELRAALDAAISSSGSANDIDALLASFATIYGAGRRFLAAIERVANDPLAPVREALREAFNTEIQDLVQAADAIFGTVTGDLRTGLLRLGVDLRKKLLDLFSAAPFRTWRRLVFALPGAHAIQANFPGQMDAVDRKVDMLLDGAARDSDFFEVLRREGPEAAAKALEAAFDRALVAAIGGARDDFEKALQAAYADWKVAAEQAGDRIEGLLYAQAVEAIEALLRTAQTIVDKVGTGEAAIRGLLEDLQTLATNAVALVWPLLEYSLAAARDVCGTFTEALLAAVNESAPPAPADVSKARRDVTDAFNKAKPALDKLGLGGRLETIGRDLDGTFGNFVQVVETLDRARQQIVKLQTDICQAVDPDRLPRDALAALGRLRSTYLLKLNDYAIALGSTRFRAAAGSALQQLLADMAGNTPDEKTARKALIEAAQAAARAAHQLGGIAIKATALAQIGADDVLKTTKAVLENLRTRVPGRTVHARLTDLIKLIGESEAKARKLKEDLEDLLTGLDRLITKAVNADDPAEAQRYLQELLEAVGKLPAQIREIEIQIVDTLERHVLSGAGYFLMAGEPYLKDLVSVVPVALLPLFKFLSAAQGLVVDARRAVWAKLGGGDKETAADGGLGDELADLTFEKVRALLLVPCPSARPGLVCPPSSSKPPDNDYLAAEKKQLDDFAALFERPDPAKLDQAKLDELRELLLAWAAGASSPQELARRLVEAASAVLSGDLKRIVDLEGVRRRIEEKIKELVPAKIVLNYDLQADLLSVSTFFIPRPGSQITLSADAVYDLLEFNVPPRFNASCRLDPFDVNLFDVVTLMFDGAHFVSESGKGSDFDITYKDFELGPNAEFLKPLQALMNPGGSGPYVRPSTTVPGIEAGYSLDLGIITIGTLSFANVAIDASCVLPFNGAAATFAASIGRADRPVLLSCLPYTGGGFLGLHATAKGLIGFEATFEFGGGGAFQFGPLSGQGRVTTGIYLRKLTTPDGRDDCIIEGFFYAGGEAHIACFAISATLVVRISHQSGGSMQGSAVFTFSFSLGFAKLRYQVGVQKKMGKGFSGNRSTKMLVMTAAAPAADETLPTVRSLAKGLEEDWLGYQRYFAFDVNGFAS